MLSIIYKIICLIEDFIDYLIGRRHKKEKLDSSFLLVADIPDNQQDESVPLGAVPPYQLSPLPPSGTYSSIHDLFDKDDLPINPVTGEPSILTAIIRRSAGVD